MNQLKAPILSAVEAIRGVYLFHLEAPEIAGEAKPGQFVMVRCGKETILPRPISVHSVDGGQIGLLFSVVGKGTGWLSQKKKGETLDIFGPLGNGYTVFPESRNLLLVAGGMGIAPLRFLADEANKQGKNITLLMGAQRAIQLLSTELLPHPMKLVISTDDGSKGNKGPTTLSIPREANQADQIFACGPIPMYRAMAKMPELKDKPCQISLEVRMGCGFGVCYGCTVKTKQGLKQVCKDGPIFNLRDVLWDELVDI